MTPTRHPPAILIGGCGYGAGNIGDEGILTGLLRLVREVSPGSRVGVIAVDEGAVRRLHGVEAWRNWPLQGVFSIMRQFDLFVCGGATLADDTLNPHYPIRYCSRLLAFARLQNLPVLISAIGANRFETREGAFLVRRFYGAADRITVRDEASRGVLRGIGIARDIQVTADPAFLAEPAPREIGQRILRESGVVVGHGPLVGVSVVNEIYGGRGEYKQAVAAACDALIEQRGVTPVFVCHDCRPDFDIVAVRETLSHMKHRRAARVLRRTFYPPDQMLSVISHFDMTFGMRMHFLIFSAVVGVPFAAVSRVDKVDNFCRLYGERPLASVEGARSDALAAKALDAFDQRTECAERIAARRSAVVAQARRTGEALAACLQRRPRRGRDTGRRPAGPGRERGQVGRRGLTRVLRAARHRLYWHLHDATVLAGRAVGWRQSRRPTSPVLVVKPDHIGDFVLFSAILESVRRFARDRRLVLVCTTEVASLLPMLPPTFDAVIVVSQRRYRRSPLSRLRTLSRIRGLGCESVLHPVYSRGVIGDELALCSGSPERIAFAGDASNMPARCHERNNRLYTRLISTEPDLTAGARPRRRDRVQRSAVSQGCGASTGKRPPAKGREIERYWQFARALNGNGELKPTWPRLVPGPLRPAMAAALAGFGAFYAMCPGAAAPYRRWGTNDYARLAWWVHQRYGLRPVICGTAEDVALAEEIAGHVPCGALSLCGRTSLADLAGVLQKGAFYVGSETGAVHVAAAVGVPTVCIIGGGHFGRFYPYVQEVAQPPPAGESTRPRAAGPHETLHVAAYRRMDCFGCNWRCVRDRPTCVESVPFDRVAACVERVMRGGTRT